MSNVQIFVEGVADQKFIQDVVLEWYGVELKMAKFGKSNGDIFDLEGKDVFTTPTKLQLIASLWEQNQKDKVHNLVIFDADTIAETLPKMKEYSGKYGFDFFLLPDNDLNGKGGDLETLLEQIINPQNQSIFDCWAEYENCLSAKDNPYRKGKKFTTPARKTKIYGYLEALLGESKSEKEQIKERERDYRNPNYWVLDADKALILKPLQLFLDKYFKTSS